MTNIPDNTNQLELPDFGNALPDFTPPPPDNTPFVFNPATAPPPRFGSDLSVLPPAPPAPALGTSLRPKLVSALSGGTPHKITPDTALGEIDQGDVQNLSRPALALPKFTVNPDDSIPVAAGKAAANLLISLPEFFESPMGVATMATGGVAPRATAGLFAADTLYSLGQQVLDMHKNFLNQTPAQQAESIVNMVGTGALAGILGHTAVKRAELPDFQPPEPVPKPPPPPELPPAEPTAPPTPPPPDTMLAEHRASLDRVTAAVSGETKQPISGLDARLSGTAQRLPSLGYAYDEAGDIFHPVRIVQPTEVPNVPTQIQQQESASAQLPRTEARPAIPPDSGEVRQGQSGEANAGNRAEPIPPPQPALESEVPVDAVTEPPPTQAPQFQSGGALQKIGGLTAKFGDTVVSVIPSTNDPRVGFITGLVGKDVASKLDDISSALKKAGFESVEYRPDNEDGRAAARTRLFESLKKKVTQQTTPPPTKPEIAPPGIAPVKFNTAQEIPGTGKSVGWFEVTAPFEAPDLSTYEPGKMVSNGQLERWGMKIPDEEQAKFQQAQQPVAPPQPPETPVAAQMAGESLPFKSALTPELLKTAVSSSKQEFRPLVQNYIPNRIVKQDAFVNAKSQDEAKSAISSLGTKELAELAGFLGWKRGGGKQELQERLLRWKELSDAYASQNLDSLEQSPAKDLNEILQEIGLSKIGNKKQKAARLIGWAQKMRGNWDTNKAEITQAEAIRMATESRQPISKKTAEAFGISGGLQQRGYIPDSSGNYNYVGVSTVNFHGQDMPLGKLIQLAQSEANKVINNTGSGRQVWNQRIREAKDVEFGKMPKPYDSYDPEKTLKIAMDALLKMQTQEKEARQNLSEMNAALKGAGQEPVLEPPKYSAQEPVQPSSLVPKKVSVLRSGAPVETPVTDRPLASAGLTSYRYKGKFGWIMIGAKDDADAINEANRSLENKDATPANLEVWDGQKYKPVQTESKPVEQPVEKPAEVVGEKKTSNPKVGEVFAREGDYEFGLTRGGLKERPEMYGIGMRRAGTDGEFESGGYGYNMKPEGVLERWAEKEVARGTEPVILHPKAQSIWDEEHTRFTKAANEKAEADRTRAEAEALKQAQWNAYSDAVKAVELPTGKKGDIEVPAVSKDGVKTTLKLTGVTRYGEWFIKKDDNKHVSEPYSVSHVKSGLRAGKFATLEQAKNFIKAMIHGDVNTNFKSAEEFAADKPNSKKIVQIAKAWSSTMTGDVPDYFNPPPTEGGTPKPVEPTPTKPGGGIRTNIGEPDETKTPQEPPAAIASTKDLEASGELLRVGQGEFNKMAAGAGEPARGGKLQRQAGRTSALGIARAESLLRGGQPVRSNVAPEGDARFQNARVVIEGGQENANEPGGSNADILAHRLLRGSYPTDPTAPEAKDFVSSLFDKLPKLKVVITDFRAGDETFAEVRGTNNSRAIYVNRGMLDRYNFSYPDARAKWDGILTEELLHEVANRVASPTEIKNVWLSLTPKEQNDVMEIYDPDRRLPGMPILNWGHEYLRIILQDRLTGKVTELPFSPTTYLKNVLQKIVDFLRNQFGAKPPDNIARQIIERLEGAIRGEPPITQSVFHSGDVYGKSDVPIKSGVSESQDKDNTAEQGNWVETIVMGNTTKVLGKDGTFNAASTAASIAHAKSVFDRLNIPVTQETRPDPRRGNLPITFWRLEDFGKSDADGQKLVSEIQKQIAESQQGNTPPDQLASLLNSVRINFEEGTLPFSEPIRQQLFNLSQGYYSWHAAILGASSMHSPDLLSVMKNVDVWLGRARYDAFGGDAFDTFFGRILKNFRNFFTPDEIEAAQKDFPSLKSLLDRIIVQNYQDLSGRVYRKVQQQWKEKFAPKLSQLKSDSRINEAAQSIIEEARKRFGIEPKPSKRKNLTPYEQLLDLVNEKNADKVSRLMEGAVADAEYNAGRRAMEDAVKTEPDAAVKQQLIDHLQLMAADETVQPLPEYVEKGLSLPEYANWKTVRDNWFDYSPVTNKLVERVISGDFRGTKFARENPEAMPADTRLDLNALAKQPEAEVQRLLNAYYENYDRSIGGAGATDAVRSKVRRQIEEKIVQQLEQARRRAREPMFTGKPKGVTKPTAEQLLQQQLNAGLFKDVRLDLPEMVVRVAAKSKVTNLLPKTGEIIQKILNTPAFRQSDIEENFVNELVDRLGVPEDQAQNAWKVFSKAFEGRMALARQRALELARKSLTPRERVVFKPTDAFWKKVERAVNAGILDSSAMLSSIAAERGWVQPSEAQTKLIKSLVDQEQHLRTLPKQQESQLRLSHPNAAPEEIASLIEQKRREQEAATYEQRSELIRRLGAEWTRMTRPVNLTPWKYFDSKYRKNNAQALNEYETLDMLLKAGFGIFRLPTHIGTQLLLHTPTRAVGRALTIRDNDILRGVKRGRVDARFWQDVSTALSDSVKATLSAFKPAVLSARAEILGRGESRNIDRLMSGINALERLAARARAEHEAGRWWNSAVLHFINLPRVVQWYVSAVDHFQGKPTEYQEILHRIEIQMRQDGKSRAQIAVAKEEVFKSMQSEFVRAMADTRSMFDRLEIDASDRQIEEAAQNLVRRRIFDNLQRLGLPADAFEQDINLLKSTVAWQEQTNRGLGGAVTGMLKGAASLGESLGIPTSITRLSNAIGTGINYSLMNTPFYKLANVKVSGSTPEESPWFRTDLDRNHRMVQAMVGTALGTVAGALALTGLARLQLMGPKDKKERDLWIAQGHKPGTIEFNLPDGTFIPVSLSVGPASLVAPYFSTFGAIHDLYSSRAQAQAKLNAEASAKGVPAGSIAPVSSLDALAVAGSALLGSIMGSRTASGLSSSVTEQGIPNAQKLAASFVSPLIPALPAYQEISRMLGVQMDPKTASVWDYMVPLPTSPHRSVNVLGEPVETPDDIQRIVQVITAGSYPLPVNPNDVKSQAAYAALFNSGYTPPSINPAKGYDIGGTYRPLNDAEMQAYTIARGQNLREALAALGPNPTRQQVRQAYQQANQQALQGVGVAVAQKSARTGAAVPQARPAARAGVAHTATARHHALLPRLNRAGHHLASGLHSRHASLLRSHHRRASLLA